MTVIYSKISVLPDLVHRNHCHLVQSIFKTHFSHLFKHDYRVIYLTSAANTVQFTRQALPILTKHCQYRAIYSLSLVNTVSFTYEALLISCNLLFKALPILCHLLT